MRDQYVCRLSTALILLTHQLQRCQGNATEQVARAGTTYKYDLSMPMERMYDLVEAVRERVQPLGPSVVVAGYGHVGDVRSPELILPRTLVLEKLHSIVCTCCHL